MKYLSYSLCPSQCFNHPLYELKRQKSEYVSGIPLLTLSCMNTKDVEFDSKHVYVHENVVEVPEDERASEIEQLEDGQELVP